VPSDQQAEAPKTDTEKAQEAASPKTEGDANQDNPIVFDVPFGDTTRQLSPQQISATFERYAKMNHEHGQRKPLFDLARVIAKANPNADPKTLASHYAKLLASNQQNPTLGKGATPTADELGSLGEDGDIDSVFNEYRENNAVDLPPYYEQMVKNQAGVAGMLKQTQQMIQQVMQQQARLAAGVQGTADAARATNQAAAAGQANTIQNQIGVNIDRAQAATGLPDEAAEDFMIFANERGYTIEDFADQNLTLTVMQDFANNRNSPEMDRLRQISQRRSAVSGAIGPTPTGGGAAVNAGNQSPTTLDRLTDQVMGGRFPV
jgi:hypothetical protein